ncbi:hypothetical protein [Embleya scabrispora]|uniref:hypothetical protein n=1 Tax=Embleya scabrispora TaxID=159449 RepID=UPI001965F0A9|nr:hypothetical protein [Embleya scabrispora]
MHILRSVEIERTRWWHAMGRRDIALCGVALPGEADPTPDDSLTDLLCPPCMSAIDRGIEEAETTAPRVDAPGVERTPAPGPA